MVSDATLRKYAKELMALYKTLHVQHIKTTPDINSYSDIWGFVSMVEDLGKQRARLVIEYYFDNKNYHGQNIKELFNNYTKYSKTIKLLEEDEASRRKLRQESAERVKVWLEQQSN